MCPQLATSSGQSCHWISLSSFTDLLTFGFWLCQFCRCCHSRSHQLHLGLHWSHWWACSLWHFVKTPMKTWKDGEMTVVWTIKPARFLGPVRKVRLKRSSGRKCKLVASWSYSATSLCLLTCCNLASIRTFVCYACWGCKRSVTPCVSTPCDIPITCIYIYIYPPNFHRKWGMTDCQRAKKLS